NLSSQFHFIYTNDFVNLFIYSHIECSSSLIFIKGSTHLSNLAKLIVRYRKNPVSSKMPLSLLPTVIQEAKQSTNSHRPLSD
ncbi:MAG: hypothetical protein J0G29_05445, partial [Alphaproteobacteria bacterium]|nr:hypothetical protein [Alphaproteobacteria bacterium]